MTGKTFLRAVGTKVLAKTADNHVELREPTAKQAKAIARAKPQPDPIDRWQAVRKGRIYCAPACGRGCTWEEYHVVRQAADTLVATLNQMKLPGTWRADVWENMGWYYCAQLEESTKGSPYTALLEVHPLDDRKIVRGKFTLTTSSYWAALQTANTIGQLVSGHRKTPALAVADVRASLKAMIQAAQHYAKEIGA